MNNFQKKSQELDRIMFAVAHDLKGPLHTISGFSDLLLEDARVNQKLQNEEDIRRIKASCEQMSRIVDAMLRIARLQYNNIKLERVALITVFEEVKQEIMDNLATQKLELTQSENCGEIDFDRKMLKILLSELVNNSLVHAQGKRIKIHVQRTTSGFDLSVEDDGMGIEETNVSRIFEFGVTLSPHNRGVGAGLTIVRKIVDFHKGEIKVYKPGNGTGFGIIMHFPEIGDSAL